MFPQIHLIIKNAISALRHELKAHVAGELALAGSTEILPGMIIPYAGVLVGPGQKYPLNARTGMPDLSYALCDGGYYTAPDGKSVQTPNLIGRFLLGAAIGAGGGTGGSTTHAHTAGADERTLSYYQLPYHRHVQNGPSPQGQAEAYLHYRKGSSQTKETCLTMTTHTFSTEGMGGSHSGRDYLCTTAVGSSEPHNHAITVDGAGTLPPYMQLYYLMKL